MRIVERAEVMEKCKVMARECRPCVRPVSPLAFFRLTRMCVCVCVCVDLPVL